MRRQGWVPGRTMMLLMGVEKTDSKPMCLGPDYTLRSLGWFSKKY